MVDPIPQEELDRARRTTCRRVASAIVKAMAETDTSRKQIGDRVGGEPDDILAVVIRLTDGEPVALDKVSDIFVAMGVELTMSLAPIPDWNIEDEFEPIEEPGDGA